MLEIILTFAKTPCCPKAVTKYESKFLQSSGMIKDMHETRRLLYLRAEF